MDCRLTPCLCGVTHHNDLQYSLIALIVGLHFFPLAPVFKNLFHYITATLLCLIPIVTLLILPADVIVGGSGAPHIIKLWWIIVGFGTAVVLYFTSLGMIRITTRMTLGVGSMITLHREV